MRIPLRFLLALSVYGLFLAAPAAAQSDFWQNDGGCTEQCQPYSDSGAYDGYSQSYDYEASPEELEQMLQTLLYLSILAQQEGYDAYQSRGLTMNVQYREDYQSSPVYTTETEPDYQPYTTESYPATGDARVPLKHTTKGGQNWKESSSTPGGYGFGPDQ